MKRTTRLKQLIHDTEILVMAGAFDPLSAKLVARAGFKAVQCTGMGIASSYLGLPDASVLSMKDMADRTAAIAHAVDLPVMADGDTGFGNAVNVWFTVRSFEEAGAAGINLEDQITPKRCGHLDGKELVSLQEMVGKVRAAVDARTDPDFVLNIRTDALAVGGVEEVVRRGNAYLEAGATMIFADGAHSREAIQALTRDIKGPVAVNMVEGGKTPKGLTFDELQQMGVARVSIPLSAFLGGLRGMERILTEIMKTGRLVDDPDWFFPFAEAQRLVGMDRVYELEHRYLTPEMLERKYGTRRS